MDEKQWDGEWGGGGGGGRQSTVIIWKIVWKCCFGKGQHGLIVLASVEHDEYHAITTAELSPIRTDVLFPVGFTLFKVLHI